MATCVQAVQFMYYTGWIINHVSQTCVGGASAMLDPRRARGRVLLEWLPGSMPGTSQS